MLVCSRYGGLLQPLLPPFFNAALPSCLLPPSLSQVSMVNRWLLRVVTQKVQQRYLLNNALFAPAVVSNQAYW